ncbi:GNAT family N-acetyltransferase [uncultured Thomasclavelia sp.]|uniref:GNAT family N-acetyltransferase n=1 Tax=uncultured Thomasclavelia sp. TaxID=3025759 RepID=UPI0025FEF068|nr:GNAT family N-acetyltransferase [uncultured Thomasclavelia sp.]
MEKIKISKVDVTDSEKLLEIYTPYILNTAITFEYEVPSVQQFRQRVQDILVKYPYLKAIKDDEIVGYAYANVFKNRAAYDWAVEVSIYIKKDMQKLGIGKKLYQALEKICQLQNITNLYACIAYPEVEDEYLTNNSVNFHQHMGYQRVGEFHQCGFKFNRWYNMVWMEKIIGEHQTTPQSVIKFENLDLTTLKTILD